MNNEIEKEIRDTVRKIMSQGDGVVSGGALSVDYIAVDEALKLDPGAKRIKIFLPTTLKIYAVHYRKRAKEGIITEKQAEDLIFQLSKIRKLNPSSIIENEENKVVDEKAYHQRISLIVRAADQAVVFHVKTKIGGAGVQETIEKAKKKGIPVKILTYIIK